MPWKKLCGWLLAYYGMLATFGIARRMGQNVPGGKSLLLLALLPLALGLFLAICQLIPNGVAAALDRIGQHISASTHKLWMKTPDGVGWAILSALLFYGLLCQALWLEEVNRLRAVDAWLAIENAAVKERLTNLETPPAEFKMTKRPLWLWKRKAKQMGWE